MKLFKSIVLWMLFGAFIFASPYFPQLNTRVVDEAGLFDKTQKAELDNKLAAHESNTTNQVVVVTLKSLDGYDIADYGYQLGRHWGIGTKEHNNGVLLIIAPNERKVRIEVGYGLEGALPDAIANTIIQNDILPSFKAGDYFSGTDRGIDSILMAIKGEYKPQQSSSGNEMPVWIIIIFVIFLVFTVIASIFLGAGEKIVPAIVSGTFAGVVSWIMFMVLGLSVFIAIVVFILTLFGNSSGSGGSGYSSGGSGFGGFDSGGGFGGGFSGGGGSFGGGGSSGSW